MIAYDIEDMRVHHTEDCLDAEYDTYRETCELLEAVQAWLDCLNVTGCYETALTDHTQDEWSEVPY